MHGATFCYILIQLGPSHWSSTHMIPKGNQDLPHDNVMDLIFDAIFEILARSCFLPWVFVPATYGSSLVALGPVYEQVGHCLQCALWPWNYLDQIRSIKCIC